jgi:hypothetical protein
LKGSVIAVQPARSSIHGHSPAVAEVMGFPSEVVGPYMPAVISEGALPSTGVVYVEVRFAVAPAPPHLRGLSGKSPGERMGRHTFVGVVAGGGRAGAPSPAPDQYQDHLCKSRGVWGLRGCAGRDALRAGGQAAGAVSLNDKGVSFGIGDCVGVLYDAGARTLQFYRNGVRLEGAVLEGLPDASTPQYGHGGTGLRLAVDLWGGRGATAALAQGPLPEDALSGAEVHAEILGMQADKVGLPRGTRVYTDNPALPGAGSGTYYAFGKRNIGANVHKIEFDIGGMAEIRNWRWPRSRVIAELAPGAAMAARRLAWCSGIHSRIGEGAWMAILSPDLVEMVGLLIQIEQPVKD